MKPTYANERYIDLMRQGIWKSPVAKTKKVKPVLPIVACDKCQDWHSGSCRSFQAKKRKAAIEAGR